MAVSNRDKPTLRIMPPDRRQSAGRIGETILLYDELSSDKRSGAAIRAAGSERCRTKTDPSFRRGGRRAHAAFRCRRFSRIGPSAAGRFHGRMSLTLTLRNADAAPEGMRAPVDRRRRRRPDRPLQELRLAPARRQQHRLLAPRRDPPRRRRLGAQGHQHQRHLPQRRRRADAERAPARRRRRAAHRPLRDPGLGDRARAAAPRRLRRRRRHRRPPTRSGPSSSRPARRPRRPRPRPPRPRPFAAEGEDRRPRTSR